MIDSKVFTSRVRIVFSPAIRKMGFKGSGNHYVRVNEDGSINCIVIQKNKHGESFTVELGAHFLVLPDVMGDDVNLKKITTYNCEFRKRISSGEGEMWWDYGKDINAADYILSEVIEAYKVQGEDYFKQFFDSNQFVRRYTFDYVLDNERLVIHQLGAATKTRLMLSLARLYIAVGRNDEAVEFCKWGIDNSKVVLSGVFKDLYSKTM